MNAVRQSPVDATATYFMGDAGLFNAYRTACLAQFPRDLQDCAAACERGDLGCLHQKAHDLKSVLLTLGLPGLSHIASECEDFTARGMLAQAVASWQQLAVHITAELAQSEAFISPEPAAQSPPIGRISSP